MDCKPDVTEGQPVPWSEYARLLRIIRAWEEGRMLHDTSDYAWRDTTVCRWCVAASDNGHIWERYSTPAEAYAALEEDK